MEIKGIIKSKHVDQIRLITTDKQQEIDVFYTDSKKFDIEELIESEQVILEVTAQSVDYYSLKLAKFWLQKIVFPKKKFVYKKKYGLTVDPGESD